MKKFILLFVSFCVYSTLFGQVSKSLTITAGNLSTALTAHEKNEITNLTLKGTIDARDFKTMRDNMPNLSVLNLSATTVLTYTGTQGTSGTKNTVYPANMVPNNAFYNLTAGTGKSSLTSFQFPASSSSIGVNAFKMTGLTSVSIPSSVTSIYDNAFYNCTALTGTIVVPSSVTTLRTGAFEKCTNITAVTISSNITSVEKRLFSDCSKLASVTLPSSITSIADSAFNNCILLSAVNFPASLTSIGVRAFYSCLLSELNFPSGLIAIGDEAFMDIITLYRVNIPSSVSQIGKNAFIVGDLGLIYFDLFFNVDNGNQFYSSLDGILYDKNKTKLIQCSIEDVFKYVIPSTVTSIGDYAFAHCQNMMYITIPSSVVSIGEYAFIDCGDLYEITVFWPEPPVFSNCMSAFHDLSYSRLLVPFGSKELYMSSMCWYEFYIVEGSDFHISQHNVSLADTANSNARVEVMSINTWIASADQPWLQVSPNTATNGTVQITITAQANTGNERSANVIIMTSTVIDTIHVIQLKLQSTILSTHNATIAAAANSTVSIDVLSSFTWIASSDQPWLSVSPTTPSTGNGTIILTATENTGPERIATVTLIAQGSMQTITITQQAGNVGALSNLSTSSINLFPNPSINSFEIVGLTNRVTVFISDLNGRVLLKKDLALNEIIDISSFSSGIYVVSIVDQNATITKKLVKR